MTAMFPASGENPWVQILSSDLNRPWRRTLSAKDMKYFSDTKRRLFDKSCPRYAVDYMRLKLKSRQPRRDKLDLTADQSVLYTTDESDSRWSADTSHRWSRTRYSSYWAHGHTRRLAHHLTPLTFPKWASNRPSLYDPNMTRSDWDPSVMDDQFLKTARRIDGDRRGDEGGVGRRGLGARERLGDPRGLEHLRHDNRSVMSNTGNSTMLSQCHSTNGNFGHSHSRSNINMHGMSQTTQNFNINNNNYGPDGHNTSQLSMTSSSAPPGGFNSNNLTYGQAVNSGHWRSGKQGYFLKPGTDVPMQGGAYRPNTLTEGGGVPVDESSIKYKNVSSHYWRQNRTISPERNLEMGPGNSSPESFGLWQQDWSPLGKLKHIHLVRNHSVDAPLAARVQGERVLEKKKIKRLMQTRYWDEFHPSKYYFKPSSWTDDEKEKSRVMTAPIANPSRIPSSWVKEMSKTSVMNNADCKSPLTTDYEDHDDLVGLSGFKGNGYNPVVTFPPSENTTMPGIKGSGKNPEWLDYSNQSNQNFNLNQNQHQNLPDNMIISQNPNNPNLNNYNNHVTKQLSNESIKNKNKNKDQIQNRNGSYHGISKEVEDKNSHLKDHPYFLPPRDYYYNRFPYGGGNNDSGSKFNPNNSNPNFNGTNGFNSSSTVAPTTANTTHTGVPSTANNMESSEQFSVTNNNFFDPNQSTYSSKGFGGPGGNNNNHFNTSQYSHFSSN